MNKIIFIIIAVIALPFVLILGNSLEVSFDASGELSDYLRYGKGDISEFSIEEQEHLEEVKQFYKKIFCIFTIAIVAFIACLYFLYPNMKKIGIAFALGGGLTLVCLFIIYLLTKNWDNAFVSFHEMFFKTQWQFPEGSLLIKMFPEEVFYNAFKKIAVNVLFSSIGLIVLGLFLWIKRI